MKKVYELPELEVVVCAQEDVLTMSSHDDKDNIADDIFG